VQHQAPPAALDSPASATEEELGMTGSVNRLARICLAGCLLLFLVLFFVLSGAATADEAEPVEVAYFALKPSIVTNLTGGPKYIRCDIQLKTDKAPMLPQIELHVAALRHAILILIAGEDGRQLQTPAGKEQLRQKALAAVQAQLTELAGEPLVSDLYFTNYYVK
jgi:flagellar FliL protein